MHKSSWILCQCGRRVIKTCLAPCIARPRMEAHAGVCVCVCVCVFVCDSEVLDVVRGLGSRPRRPSGGLYSNMEFS